MLFGCIQIRRVEKKMYEDSYFYSFFVMLKSHQFVFSPPFRVFLFLCFSVSISVFCVCFKIYRIRRGIFFSFFSLTQILSHHTNDEIMEPSFRILYRMNKSKIYAKNIYIKNQSNAFWAISSRIKTEAEEIEAKLEHLVVDVIVCMRAHWSISFQQHQVTEKKKKLHITHWLNLNSLKRNLFESTKLFGVSRESKYDWFYQWHLVVVCVCFFSSVLFFFCVLLFFLPFFSLSLGLLTTAVCISHLVSYFFWTYDCTIEISRVQNLACS